MIQNNWSKFSNDLLFSLKKNSPEILMAIGIVGLFTTPILAVKNTPEALRLIEQKKHEINQDKLTPLQTVQATWKCYIPAAVTSAVSTACLVGSGSINHKRNAALVTVCGLSETALREYQNKVVETVGEKKEKVIRDSIDKERLEKNPPTKEIILAQPENKTLCYDALCGRYFYSDVETLRHAANELNRRMTTYTEPYVSLNDFYREIDLSSVEVGESLGWNIDKGMVELSFSSQIVDDSKPCLVMDFKVRPDYKFSKF